MKSVLKCLLCIYDEKSHDQLTSGFEHCLNWHQDLHSKLLCLERRKEFFLLFSGNYWRQDS